MSKASCGKFGLRAPLIHCGLELRECAAQRRVILRRVGHEHGQAWAEKTGVYPSEEQGETESGFGDPIALRPRKPRDQAVKAQAPQLVRQSPRGDRVRGQPEER